MVLSIVVLFLLLVGFSKLALSSRKEVKRLRGKLSRLASTDNEIICVLEATDSPLSKKLLRVARAQRALPAARTTPSGEEWGDMLAEVRAYKSDVSKARLVRSWVRRGVSLSPAQRSLLMGLFKSDTYRESTTRLLDRTT